MKFQWHSVATFAEQHFDKWRRLGETCVSPNVYLMPEFVLPAQHHLMHCDVQVASVWDEDNRLRAIGLFSKKPRSWRFPYPRLISFYTRHSYQSGLLIDKDQAEHNVRCMLSGLFESTPAVQFNELRTDSEVYELLQKSAQSLNLDWTCEKAYDRAVLKNPLAALCGLSKSRKKSIRRAYTKLSQSGDVNFKIIPAEQIADIHVEQFLQLERSGWKQASALLGNQANEDFFRELVARSKASGSLFFAQLTLNQKPIAATSNFVLGQSVFAFKIGFDPAFAKCSPGILVEVEFLKWCATHQPNFLHFDSGAQPGSYIEEFWPDRASMASGTLLRSGLPQRVFALKSSLKYAFTRANKPNMGGV